MEMREIAYSFIDMWASNLETQTRPKKLLSAQRIAALRVISLYRVVSTQVIAGLAHINLQEIERRMICCKTRIRQITNQTQRI